jgi:hypothetical protein
MASACKLCTHPDQQTIEAAFASGGSDRAIGRQFGVSHMAAYRHRTAHIVKPTRDKLAVISKAADARKEREQLAVAAAVSSPSLDDFIQAAVGMRTQLAKLADIERRLERMAACAEGAQSAAGVAVLSSQQIRSLEFGSKLGGIGGFAPVRSPETMPPGTKFEVYSFPQYGNDRNNHHGCWEQPPRRRSAGKR